MKEFVDEKYTIGESIICDLRDNTVATLYLCCESIGDSATKILSEALRNNTSLTSLYLSGNLIGKDGAIELAKALRMNTSLQSLFLGYNNIPDQGALALAEAIKTNTSLTLLQLTNNELTYQGAQYLAEAMKTNSSIVVCNLQDRDNGEDQREDKGKEFNMFEQQILNKAAKNKKAFEKKCDAIHNKECDKLSLKDIQLLFPLLNVHCMNPGSNNHYYTKIKDTILSYFRNNILHVIFGDHLPVSLPSEVMAYIANDLVPQDIDLSPQPAQITYSHELQPSSFLDSMVSAVHAEGEVERGALL